VGKYLMTRPPYARMFVNEVATQRMDA
jgi:hypothetical protein